MKKVLIVDDNQTFSKTLSNKLVSLSYQVLLAEDGLVGLEMAEKEKPDLVLLDIKMPNLDGMGFLKAIKEKGLSIPVVITSDLSTTETISDGIAQGVKGYIIKSNESLDTIVKEVEDVLKNNN